MSNMKLDAIVGMFHDGGSGSFFLSNVAAGSERTGFSGPGLSCDSPGRPSFDSNAAHSCLFGFLFDFYAAQRNALPCISLGRFTAWKIWHYGVYGEILAGSQVTLTRSESVV